MAAFLVMSGLLNGSFAALDRGALLRLLRGDADPDVPGHRRLGRAQPGLCGSQVLPVYAARVASDVDAFLYLYNKSGGSFAVLDYHKLPLPLNAQILLFIAFLMASRWSANVARAHLAPGRARRGADQGLGCAGGRSC